MKRREFLNAAGIGGVLLLLEACWRSSPVTVATGSTIGTSPVPTTAPTAAAPVRSPAPVSEAVSHLTRTSTVPGDEHDAASSTNAFAYDLVRQLADPESNLVISPASILLALSMTRVGARGTTESEMNAVLHVPDPATIDHSINALTTLLSGRNGMRHSKDRDGEVELSIANAVWARREIPWKPPFLDILAAQYGSGVSLVDFAADPDAARTAINEWVATGTRQRITELLERGMIDAGTMMVLVNAIYFRAGWATPFDKRMTSPAAFTKADGSSVEVEMMHCAGSMPYASGRGWQATALAYVGDELQLALVVPDAGRSGDVAGRLGEVVEALARPESADVTLGLPKFDFGTKTDLVTVLSALGMPSAFSDADFSGMTEAAGLSIAAVVHQANVAVDEEGTVAAAATAVVMAASATTAPPRAVTLILDRPFLFAVRDVSSGTILFLGVVNDPAVHAGAAT